MGKVRISMIAAVGANGAIGADNALPWRLPTDFAFYKATTMGKPLVMGRKTFQSIGKPLPGRANLIVTRQADYRPEGVEVFDSLDAAIDRARDIAARAGTDEVFINGGAEIYRQAMAKADRLYITHVAASPRGDAFFPDINLADWDVSERADIKAGERDSNAFTIRVYDRRH